MSARPITLLTDFGTRDGYVAALKGVIASESPDSIVHDASHDIEPGNVLGAAFALKRYWMMFPRETVHVVVVDPGVGSARRAIAVRANDRYLVGPDNGVLSLALRDAETFAAFTLLPDRMLLPTLSNTFHGRDLFAPAAARLAAGRALKDLGEPTDLIEQLALPKARIELDFVEGEVVYIDRFGNLITNIEGAALPEGSAIELEGRSIGPVRTTYSDVSTGEIVAVINSDRVLEIGVREGNAARKFGFIHGARVRARS